MPRLAEPLRRPALIVSLAGRNLLRQKRRNALLGVAIAFGATVLLMAGSFARGITDILFNRLMVFAFGHIRVTGYENGRFFGLTVHRDLDGVTRLVLSNAQGVAFADDAVDTMVRLVGNGRGANSVLVGFDLSKDYGFDSPWEILEGDLADFTNGRIASPMMLYADQAKKLNVRVGDTVRGRLTTISGQQQSASFTVVALFKPLGMVQSMAAFVPKPLLKSLLGYAPTEGGALQIVLKNPKTAIRQADRIHKALEQRFGSPLAIPVETRSGRGPTLPAHLMGFRKEALDRVRTEMTTTLQGDLARITNEGSVAVSPALARGLGLRVGDRLSVAYGLRRGGRHETTCRVVAVVSTPDASGGDRYVFAAERTLHGFYPRAYPEAFGEPGFAAAQGTGWKTVLLPRNLVLPRSRSFQEMDRKFRDLRNRRYKGPALDVSTMYETMSMVVQLEGALNIITLVAVVILFFIILVGVVNNLRMSIRERTREIGTLRAIGMQERDVRDLFLAEVLILTVLAVVAGHLLGLLLMNLLRFVKFHTSSPLSILLVDKRLHFVTTLPAILGNTAFILVMAAAAAWGPCRQAARMVVAEALRHYE